MKLHLCCGDVYLDGYLNFDIEGRVLKHGEHPSFQTTLKYYYQNRRVGDKRETVMDGRMDLTRVPWGFRDNGVEGVVMISAIEHFPLATAQLIVAEIRRVLKPGCKFLVDFPNLEETIQKYYRTDPGFCMKHIYCNHRNTYLVHHWGYTRATFRDLLGEGWKIKFRQIVKHSYPIIGCEAIKI